MEWKRQGPFWTPHAVYKSILANGESLLAHLGWSDDQSSEIQTLHNIHEDTSPWLKARYLISAAAEAADSTSTLAVLVTVISVPTSMVVSNTWCPHTW